VKFTSSDLRQRVLPILASQAVGLGCGLAGVRLTSRWVLPADYGLYGIFLTLTPLGMTVVFGGLIKFASRKWPESTDRGGVLRAVLGAAARKFPWLVLATAAAALAVPTTPRGWFALTLLGSATALFLVQLTQTVLQSMRAHWPDFGLSAIASATRAFAPPLLYAATGAGLTALLAGFSFHALVAAAAAMLVLRAWWRQPATGAHAPALGPVYGGSMFMLLAAVGWVQAGWHRWIVAWFFGAETAGQFVLATNLGALLPSMLGVMLLQFFQPGWFTAAVDTREERRMLLRRVDRVALVCTVAGVALSTGLHFAMPLLIGTLIGPAYAPAAGYILGTGCLATAMAVGIFHHVLLLAVRRERACGVTDLSGAVCFGLGGLVAVTTGGRALNVWLCLSPLVPWLVNRTVARWYVLAE
jgi:hypothetical protein